MSECAEAAGLGHSEQLGELAGALAGVQGQIRGAAKESTNPALRNRYADLASVWDACREPLTAAGLAVVQGTHYDAVSGDLFLQTMLIHKSGQWISCQLPLSPQGNKGVNEMQALGSAITYARRYLLASMVGICPADDDGQASGPPRDQPYRNGQNGPARDGHDRNPPRSAPAAAPAPAWPPIQGWWAGFLTRARSGWAKAVAAEPRLTALAGDLPAEPLWLLDKLYVLALDANQLGPDAVPLPTDAAEPELLAALDGYYRRNPADVERSALALVAELAQDLRHQVTAAGGA